MKSDVDSSSFSDFEFPANMDLKFSLWSRQIREETCSPTFQKEESSRRFMTQQSPEGLFRGKDNKENTSPNFSLAQESGAESRRSKSYLNAMVALQQKNTELQQLVVELRHKASHSGEEVQESKRRTERQLEECGTLLDQLKDKARDLEDRLFNQGLARKSVEESLKTSEEELKRNLEKERQLRKKAELQVSDLQSQLRIAKKERSIAQEKHRQTQAMRQAELSSLEKATAEIEKMEVELEEKGKAVSKLSKAARQREKEVIRLKQQLFDSEQLCKQLQEAREQLLKKSKEIKKKDKMLARVEKKIHENQQLIEQLRKQKKREVQKAVNTVEHTPAQSPPRFVHHVRPHRIASAVNQDPQPARSAVNGSQRRADSGGKAQHLMRSLRNSLQLEESVLGSMPLQVYRQIIKLQDASLKLIETHGRIRKELQQNKTMDREVRSQVRKKMFQVSAELAQVGKKLSVLKLKENLIK